MSRVLGTFVAQVGCSSPQLNASRLTLGLRRGCSSGTLVAASVTQAPGRHLYTKASRLYTTSSHVQGNHTCLRSSARATAVVIAAAFGLVASSAILADASPTSETVVDPATGASLPRNLAVPTDSGNSASAFHLVGYGARQVTFLSINVYSVGIYVPKSFLPTFASNCISTTDCNLEKSLSQSTSPLAIYLVPARNSSAAHLRDGFVRTFMTAIAKAGPEADREKMLDDVNKFKAAFPTAAVEKGHKFVFVYLPGRGLRIMHQGVDQGVVESPWLAKALFEAYLRTDKPISPNLRANLIGQLVPNPSAALSESK